MADGIVTLTTSTFDETVRASAKPIHVRRNTFCNMNSMATRSLT